MPKRKKKAKKIGKRTRVTTSARLLKPKERHLEWVKKRIEGWTLRQIAEEDGVTPGAVCLAVQKYQSEVGVEEAEQLIRLDVERIDTAIRGIWPKTKRDKWDRDRVDRLCRLISTRQKILGTTLIGAAPEDTGGKAADAIVGLFTAPDFLEWYAQNGREDQGGTKPKTIDVEAKVSDA